MNYLFADMFLPSGRRRRRNGDDEWESRAEAVHDVILSEEERGMLIPC